MTVLELMAELSALSEQRRVIVYTDHGQCPVGVVGVSEDLRDGELWLYDELEDETSENFESIVVIFGG